MVLSLQIAASSWELLAHHHKCGHLTGRLFLSARLTLFRSASEVVRLSSDIMIDRNHGCAGNSTATLISLHSIPGAASAFARTVAHSRLLLSAEGLMQLNLSCC